MNKPFNLVRFASRHGGTSEVETLETGLPVRRKPQKQTRIFPPRASKYTAFLETWVALLEADQHPTAGMYKMALAIQRAATLQNTLTPKVSNDPLDVHRSTKYKSLPRLAKLGMIQVLDTGRGRGRSAVVSIIIEPNKQKE
jgi:hypothetical protein